MAETKAIPGSEASLNAGERTIRTYEEALNAEAPPPMPSQEEADAIKEGTYEGGGDPPPPEGDTQEAKRKREEAARKQREASAQAGTEGTYKTR